MVGHSLGGLYLRYCIGLMEKNNFFQRFSVTPACFASVASPHLGFRILLNFSGMQGNTLLASFGKLTRTHPTVSRVLSSVTETFMSSPLFGRTGK